MSQQALADALTNTPGMANYDRSMVQKMTVGRGVSLNEAKAISAITKFPLPSAETSSGIDAQFSRLTPENQAVVTAVIAALLGDE